MDNTNKFSYKKTVGGYVVSSWLDDDNVKDVRISSVCNDGNVVKIAAKLFCECKNIKSVSIDEGITDIEQQAFVNCVNLEEIRIPQSVVKIGRDAFKGCKNLKSIYISDVDAWCTIDFVNEFSNPLYHGEGTLVGADLYLNENLLEKLEIPKGVHKINDFAFINCKSLMGVDVRSDRIGIGRMTFYNCVSLTYIDFHESILDIGWGAFGNCSSLRDISIPNGIIAVRDWVFYRCSSLSNVNLPYSLKSIGEYAFYGCNKLKNVNIPDGVMSISEGAFDACASLENIILPDNLVFIGRFTFYDCISLSEINIPRNIATIGESAFFNCSSLTEIHFDAEVMADLNPQNNVFYNVGREKGGTTVTIGDGVTRIPAYIFNPCDSSLYAPKITNVSFGRDSGCKRIEAYSFAYLRDLKCLLVPPSVTYIAKNTFCKPSEFFTCLYLVSSENEINKNMASICRKGLMNAMTFYFSKNRPYKSGNYWHYVGEEIVRWQND